MPRNYMKNDDRRELILNTACRLFAEKGYDLVTTKMLAKEVGCSEALLYRYFPSKDSIYDVLFEEYSQAQKEPVVLDLIGGSAIRTLRELFEALSAWEYERKTATVVRNGLYQAVQNRPSYMARIQAVVMEGNDIVVSSIVPIIETGKAAGEIRSAKDSLTLGKIFWAICTGVTFLADPSGINRGRASLSFDDIAFIFN